MNYIDIQNLTKRYVMGDSIILANDEISLSIEKGELSVIVGPSGSGKSTLLNILGGIDTADEGALFVDGQNIANFDERSLTRYRRHDVGFVFQFYNLIPNLTALENVELANQIVPNAQDAAKTLELVGLGDRLNNFPAQLSGGEQQRVAIARALAKRPKLLLADEPTGALDYTTGKQILTLLQTASREWGTTVVIITHNTVIAPIANRVIRLGDARVREITCSENPVDIRTIEW